MTLTRLICLVGGLILLAPGLCSLYFVLVAASEFRGSASDLNSLAFLIPIWVVGLAIGAFGAKLIADGVRPPAAGWKPDGDTEDGR